MIETILACLGTLGLLIGILLCMEVGRKLGERRLALDPQGARSGVGAVEGAVFGLLGLLLAFTFSGAAARFDARRTLIVEEANDIGTAFLRIDLVAPEAQAGLRDLFRRYTDSRIETYRRLPDLVAAREELEQSKVMQRAIWKAAAAATAGDGYQPARMLLLPALNQMIDITTTRTMAGYLHPPKVIFAMLFGLSLVGALLVGYGMAGAKTRGKLHTLGYALIMAAAIYVISDLELPRFGFIRVDQFDSVLQEVRADMD